MLHVVRALTAALASLTLTAPALAQELHMPIVRLARIEIDPAQMKAYRAELREEIETSIAREPGVQALYAVAEQDHPARLHLMEIYADHTAYEAHVASPHFLKYKAATKEMVRSLRMLQATPIMLGAKPSSNWVHKN